MRKPTPSLAREWGVRYPSGAREGELYKVYREEVRSSMDIIGFWFLLLDFLIICLVFGYYDYERLFIMYELKSLFALAPSYTYFPAFYTQTHIPRKDESLMNACRDTGIRICNFQVTSSFTTTELIHDISQKTWST